MPRLNDYLYCQDCRYWKQSVVIKDRFFGEVQRPSYCTKKDRIVHPTDAKDCRLFIQR